MEDGTTPTAEQQLRNILAAMAEKGITDVEVQYDGIGDSGNIADIRFHDGNGAVAMRADLEPIAEMLDEAIFPLLGSRKPGWELNSGSYGEISLSTAEDTVELDHYWRTENYDGDIIDLSEADLAACEKEQG